MRTDLLLLAADLSRRSEAFVLATVVRREPPSSARVGDSALVTQGGTFHGWLGGSCTQPTVVREGLRALADGRPRLIALSPDPAADRRQGIEAFPMTCHSGGSVDIYIEPQLPAPRLVVFGLSPVAQALTRVAHAMGYSVDAVDPAADRAAFPEADRVFTSPAEPLLRQRTPAKGATLAVAIATMGDGDDAALAAALDLEPGYIGLVASRRRFATVRDALIARGIPTAALERIKCPAGLDIGAHSPAEIAVSIMAELVERVHAKPEAARSRALPVAAGEARDPVCGMMVTIAGARHTATHAGRTVYFCCGGCRERFLASPESYPLPVETGQQG
jgi:xanthine dehydrogenase accessory factor